MFQNHTKQVGKRRSSLFCKPVVRSKLATFDLRTAAIDTDEQTTDRRRDAASHRYAAWEWWSFIACSSRANTRWQINALLVYYFTLNLMLLKRSFW